MGRRLQRGNIRGFGSFHANMLSQELFNCDATFRSISWCGSHRLLKVETSRSGCDRELTVMCHKCMTQGIDESWNHASLTFRQVDAFVGS